MKADVELMLKVAARAVEQDKKVYAEVRGDSEPRGPMRSVEGVSEGGAALVRMTWATGHTYCRPEDLLAITVNDK